MLFEVVSRTMSVVHVCAALSFSFLSCELDPFFGANKFSGLGCAVSLDLQAPQHPSLGMFSKLFA
jgi:hypothetical protein